MTKDKTATSLLRWIDTRMHGATRNIVEALQLMRSVLMNHKFDPPERWRLGREARRASAVGPTYNDVAEDYIQTFNGLANSHLSLPPGERHDMVRSAIETANHIGSSVYWRLHEPRLDVAPVIRPVADDFQRLPSVTLELTVADEKVSETETVNLRLSEILEILPQMPGSQVDDESIQRGLTQLDKCRLDDEITRCFDSLNGHREFFHPTKMLRWTDRPRFHAMVHCSNPDHHRRWSDYNNRVLELHRNELRLGNIREHESRLSDDHPYMKLVTQMCHEPRNDLELGKIAGAHVFKLLDSDLERLTQAGLGAVEAELQLTPKPRQTDTVLARRHAVDG